MNEKTQPAPADQSGGQNPEKQARKPARTPRTGRSKKDPESLVIQRSIGLTKRQWKKLGEDAAMQIRGLVDAMPEKQLTP